MWVSECLQGKYKGLEKAARIYNAALEQPMYFRLVILELMENLTSGDEIMRKNSLWMLSKLVEERYEYSFMSPTIQILIASLREKSQIIRFYALKVINQIAQSYYEPFRDALPEIVNHLRDGSSKIRIIAAAIVTQFIEANSNALESAIDLLVKALKEKESETREVAIKGLLRIDQQIDQVVEAIMDAFQDQDFRASMIKHIFDFIKRNPSKVVDALRKTIKNRDTQIRENSIVFMHQIAETKHVSDLIKAVPELLKAFNDKNKVVRRTAARILFLISKTDARALYRGKNRLLQLIKIKNQQLVTYFTYIIVRMIRYFPDELEAQIDELIKLLEKLREEEEPDPELEITNIISLCTLLRYRNEIAVLLNLAQDCLAKYGGRKEAIELFMFLGYTHYYLGNYAESIQAFLKAESAYKREDYYTAAIADVMIAFNFALLRTFNSCIDYKIDAEKYYEMVRDRVPIKQFQQLQLLIDFINGIAAREFAEAETSIRTYYSLLEVKHPLEEKYQLITLENIQKVHRFYQETQEILETIKKDGIDDEPQVIDK
ncbi:MAG: hypothetical protein EU536_03590 [Promethearchaeota archaeon]|nr:MAG: hypothetical protein EU536_03590 [Candidatus Lokiarchaeota archaeon]